MKMKYFDFLALIIGAQTLIEVRCQNQMVIRNGDPGNTAKGYNYERFNFLNEVKIDGKSVEDEFYWNTCSNYTGIDLFLNATGSEDCLGQVTDCTINSIDAVLFPGSSHIFKLDTNQSMEMTTNVRIRESCHCLCTRLYDRKPHSAVPELLDSICLDEVSADVGNNYVLTGVRLYRLKNTLMFQIQQGKMKEGRILPNTRQWVPPPKRCNKIGELTVSKRTLILDDVILPRYTVATGVAFKRYSDIPQDKRRYPESPEVLEEDPFFLTVIGHGLSFKFNVMADIKVESSVWNYTLENRINLIDDDMDIPIALEHYWLNRILSKPGENYVTFELTKPEQGLRKFVIPYVDSNKVTTLNNPDKFVRGIGFYYKGYEGHGGYIAPSIIVSEYH